MKKVTLLVLLTTLVPVTATAEPIVDSIGARVGGYGFREPTPASGEEKSGTGWQACRMNGIGVFVNRKLDDTFFVEGGLDTYFADDTVVGNASDSYDTPIDRVSGLLSVSAGARLYAHSLISPYLQLGIGAELTRVRLPALAMEDTALLPFGFFGVGATMHVSSRLDLGTVFRVNAMGYYDDAQFQTEMEPEAELATQGQFYAAFSL
jgi:hypothetical protein